MIVTEGGPAGEKRSTSRFIRTVGRETRRTGSFFLTDAKASVKEGTEIIGWVPMKSSIRNRNGCIRTAGAFGTERAVQASFSRSMDANPRWTFFPIIIAGKAGMFYDAAAFYPE
ncbi:MAG: hypothetical protein HPY65_09220 [Syntrophaceae bacterium]|nr:hypothetical protein [Syntrophaceae bacterium]